MPKSKKARAISFTRTKSVGKPGKASLIDEIQHAASKYPTCYVFRCNDMRTSKLKELRAKMMKDSRFFFGKKTVMRVALGRNSQEAFLEGMDKISSELKGEVGLLFTKKKPADIEKFFDTYSEIDFTRAGAKATSTEVIPAGQLKDPNGYPFPSSMFEQFRKLQLPLKLKVGILELEDDYTICKEGEVLNPEQAQLLRLFGRKLATFRIELIVRWREGEVTRLAKESADQGMDVEDDDDDDDEEEEEEEEEDGDEEEDE